MGMPFNEINDSISLKSRCLGCLPYGGRPKCGVFLFSILFQLAKFFRNESFEIGEIHPHFINADGLGEELFQKFFPHLPFLFPKSTYSFRNSRLALK